MNLGSGDASTKSSEQTGSSASAAQTPGALLEQERRRRGLTIQEAAETLHLDAWIIEAIESNRFLALGAPVYAKGYLRKYAVMLGLAPDVIVARYDALTDTLPEPTPVPVMTTAPPPRPKWPKYVGWALLAAILIGVGFLLFKFVWPLVEGLSPADRQSTVTAPAEAIVAEAPPPAVEPPSAAPDATPAATEPATPEPVTTPVDTTPRAEAASAPTEASSPAAIAAADSVRVTLAFDTPSWVEVYDGAGGRLMYDIGQAGRVHTLQGRPPINVVIGVAAAVKVRVNDRDIVVPRRANRDSTRFTVAADGSVR